MNGQKKEQTLEFTKVYYTQELNKKKQGLKYDPLLDTRGKEVLGPEIVDEVDAAPIIVKETQQEEAPKKEIIQIIHEIPEITEIPDQIPRIQRIPPKIQFVKPQLGKRTLNLTYTELCVVRGLRGSGWLLKLISIAICAIISAIFCKELHKSIRITAGVLVLSLLTLGSLKIKQQVQYRHRIKQLSDIELVDYYKRSGNMIAMKELVKR